MKLLLGTDVTDRENEVYDGEVFFTRRIPEELEHEQDKLGRKLDRLEKRGKLPKALGWIRGATGTCAVMTPFAIIEACAELDERSKKWDVVLIFIGIAVVMGMVSLVLSYIENKRMQKVINSPEYTAVKEGTAAFAESSDEVLGIPDDAVRIDLFAARFYRDDGKMYCADSETAAWYYENVPGRLWKEDGHLCLADHCVRMEIPLDAFRNAETVKKGCFFSAWNKEGNWTDAKYGGYKVRRANGLPFVPRYLAIHLEYEGEEYELRVPPWEKRALEDLTGWSLG